MWTLMRRLPVCLGILLLIGVGCSNNKFRGSGSSSKPAPTVNPDPDPKTINRCKDKQSVVGVDLAFVIDNSGSNAHTDCPNAQVTGSYRDESGNSFPRYTCGGQTDRERAVVDAYTSLSSIAKGDAASDSQLGVASFPSNEDIYSGSDIRTQQWLAVSSQSEQSLSSSMGFTKSPIGMTPYGSGLTAAAEMIDRLPDSNRAKLLILVSDGEPTDENPGQVVDQVKSRFRNVKIVTVLVTQQIAREARKAEHAQYLREKLNYSQGVIDQLIGGNGEQGLIEDISDQVVEVPLSGQLTGTFDQIIAENVKCE